jgi:hypothetical protein
MKTGALLDEIDGFLDPAIVAKQIEQARPIVQGIHVLLGKEARTKNLSIQLDVLHSGS